MSFNKIILCVFACLLFSSRIACAQFDYKIYSLKEGLPQSDVCAMDEDSLGYLWVGMNAGGLAKFDGKTFKKYGRFTGLNCPEVTDLTIDQSGKLWVATMRTISSYDGTKFIDHLTFPASQAKEILYRGDTLFFRNLREPQWQFLFNEKSGVVSEHHPLQGIFQSIKIQRGLFIGLNHYSDQIVIFDSSGYRHVPAKEKFQEIYEAITANEDIILSTNKGIFRVTANQLYTVNASQIDVHSYDSEENIYWYSFNNNLFYTANLNETGTPVAKIAETGINRTFKDSEGNTWFCTHGRGLIKVFKTSFHRISENDPYKPKEIVRSIHQTDNGEIWLGTIGSGIRVYKNGKLIRSFDESGLSHVGSIVEDSKGKIWVGTNIGIFTFFNKKWEHVFRKEIPNVYAMDIDKNDDLLISSRNGNLFTIRNNIFSRAGGMMSHIRQIVYDKLNDRFIIAFNDGIRFFSEKKLSAKDFVTLSANSVAIRSDTAMIIGTAGYGLHILRPDKKTVITSDDGLIDDYIYFVIPDRNYIWLGTNRGVDRVELNANLSLKGIEHFNEFSGFHELECDLNAFYKNDSVLFVGLISGAYQYDPDVNQTYRSHPLHFTKIKFIDTNQNPSSSNSKGWALNGKYNHLTFAVNTVSQIHGNDITYAAELEGPISSKTETQKGGEFDFANLPPGEYLLKVTSTDPSNLNYRDQLTLKFSIAPWFYQTLWFRILSVLTLTVLLLFVIRFHHRKKYKKLIALNLSRNQEEQKLRKEISRDFHDELGNDLARMSNYLILLQLRNEVKNDIYETLFLNTQKILVGAKDFIWTLDPENNDIANIVIHLKDFGERMFREKQIDFSFLGEIPQEVKVPTGYSRQINLIFKEAMTNSFRHSQATEIAFGITKEQNKITLFLKDNGKGIPPDYSSATGGLVNVRARANKIGADFYMKSDATETFIAVTFKV